MGLPALSVDAAAADEVEKLHFGVALGCEGGLFIDINVCSALLSCSSTSRINVLFLGFFLFFLNIILDKQLQRQFPSATQKSPSKYGSMAGGSGRLIGLKLFKNFFIRFGRQLLL